ncbi:MAG: avidin/streptavidin family protein [Candidatus Sulfotelmatobacter sp.]
MNIQGIWYNELGSTMVISGVNNGQITGTYATAVSATACAQGTFVLTGRTDTDNGGEGIGFVVSWQNAKSRCESVTAWSGQAQNIGGEDCIVALWLLTVESAPDQDWYATHVGQDVFTRLQPSADSISKKAKTLRRSHP